MKIMQADKIFDLVIKSLEDLKAIDIQVLDVTALTTITSKMVVCTGTSRRHVKALADNVVSEVKHAGFQPYGVEGSDESEWVLVDLGETVVHIMQAQARALYQLEKLWSPEMAAADDSDQAAK